MKITKKDIVKITMSFPMSYKIPNSANSNKITATNANPIPTNTQIANFANARKNALDIICIFSSLILL